MLIDEHLGGKADRKQLEKAKFVSALFRMANKIEAHSEIIKGNDSIARSLYSAFKTIGEEKNDFTYIEKALNGYESLLASS
jgi:hypothetical protein